MEQRWFAGVHCDIGGGYEDSGLSDITLRWMMDCATQCGLVLDGPALAPKPDAIQHNEMSGFYSLLGKHVRPIDDPATLEAVEKGRSTPDETRPEFVGTNEVVDESARIRLKKPDYRPANLIAYLQRRGEPVPQ